MGAFVMQCEKPVIRQHSFWHVMALAIFMLLSFSTLKYLPGMLIVQDIWTAVILAGVLYVYLPYVLKHGWLNIWFEGYVLMMMVLAPLISAVGALNEFGQPLFYGLAAGRSTLLMGAGLLYTVMFRTRIVDLELTRRAVTLIAGISVVGWSIASVTVDLTAFDEPIPGLVEIGEGAKLLLDPSFIVFGYFYYLFSCFLGGVRRHGWIALAILAYLVLGMGGRLCIAATLVTSAVFLWKSISVDRMLIVSVKLALGVGMLVAVLYAINAEKVELLVEKFGYAVEVVLSGEEVEEVSAQARLLEKRLAEPYIEKNFWFGNGLLSVQWEDGFKGRFGYFHPNDIGMFGAIFQYGAVVFLLFLIQFLFVAYSRNSRRESFDLACVAVIFYWFIYSFGTGWFALVPEQTIFVISILISLTLSCPVTRGRNAE